MVRAAAELHLHTRQSANMAARLRARLAVTNTAKSQAEDKIKYLVKNTALLIQEKDAEIKRMQEDRTHLEGQKALLEGNVTSMEKAMESVVALNSTIGSIVVIPQGQIYGDELECEVFRDKKSIGDEHSDSREVYAKPLCAKEPSQL
ncbi:hypothetical protein AgCh_028643 [Apium graveolens]